MDNTSGRENTAVGADALPNNTTGQWNNALGDGAMFANTTGSNNTGIARGTLRENTTGSNNTAVGLHALWENRARSNSTAIGTNAMYYADSTTVAGNANNTAVVITLCAEVQQLLTIQASTTMPLVVKHYSTQPAAHKILVSALEHYITTQLVKITLQLATTQAT